MTLIATAFGPAAVLVVFAGFAADFFADITRSLALKTLYKTREDTDKKLVREVRNPYGRTTSDSGFQSGCRRVATTVV